MRNSYRSSNAIPIPGEFRFLSVRGVEKGNSRVAGSIDFANITEPRDSPKVQAKRKTKKKKCENEREREWGIDQDASFIVGRPATIDDDDDDDDSNERNQQRGRCCPRHFRRYSSKVMLLFPRTLRGDDSYDTVWHGASITLRQCRPTVPEVPDFRKDKSLREHARPDKPRLLCIPFPRPRRKLNSFRLIFDSRPIFLLQFSRLSALLVDSIARMATHRERSDTSPFLVSKTLKYKYK